MKKLLCALLLVLPLSAGDLPPDIKAKFIKILASSAGTPTMVGCKDSSVASELSKMGLNIDNSSKLVYAGSDGEVKAAKAAGKLIVCGNLNQLPIGGAIAIVEENGKPSIYLHMGNIAASGVTLSDAILKIGKKL